MGSHIFKLHQELRDDDSDTHDPYPAPRGKRIPQRVRRGLAEGQRGVQGEATGGSGRVCVREQYGPIAEDYHMASPCSTLPARLPVC